MMKVWLSRSAQYLIALILISTGIGKLLDNRGFAQVLETYQLLPEALLLPMGVLISLFELIVGWQLLRSQSIRRNAMLSTLMHGFYAGVAVVTLLRGLEIPNCGCFGVFLARPLTWSTPIEDGVLVVISYILFKVTRSDSSRS